jgi:hypothetical protein
VDKEIIFITHLNGNGVVDEAGLTYFRVDFFLVCGRTLGC